MTRKATKHTGFADGYKTYDTSDGHGTASELRSRFRERMGYDEAERIVNEQGTGPYAILGIADNASGETIKLAFRKLVFYYHPDRIKITGLTLAVAQEMTQRVIAAYTMLTDKRARRR